MNRRLLRMILILILICLGAVIVRQKLFPPSSPRMDAARPVLERLLNAPDQGLKLAYEKALPSAPSSSVAGNGGSQGISAGSGSAPAEIDDTQIRSALEDILDSKAADPFIESCIRQNDLTALHYDAVKYGFCTSVKKLSLRETTQDGKLTYDVKLAVHMEGRDDRTVPATGIVQFDESGKISAMTLQGRELNDFYASLDQ